MSKKTGFRLAGLVGMVFILFVSQAPTEEKGWKKTVTLPSGEVVCDLNGEWEVLVLFRGSSMDRGELRYVNKIIQQGNSFKSIRITGDPWSAPGTVTMEGELDKNGILKFICESCSGISGQKEYEAKLSQEGNLIEYNDRGNNFFVEYKRK